MESQTGFAKIFPITTVLDPKLAFHSPFFNDVRSYRKDFFSTAIFNAIWTRAVDGMRLTDENGIIVAVNKAFCDLVEMKEHDLVGRLFTVIYSQATDRDRLLSTYQTIFSTGLYQTIFELNQLSQSGKTLEVETFTTYIESDRGNKLLLTQFRDITERKKTERILQESETKYRGLFANSIQPMFESSMDGKITNANTSFLRLLGYRCFDDIFNLNLLHDVYFDVDERRDLMKILDARGYIRNIEIKVKRKNGKVLTVLEHARALRDNSGVMIGIEGVFEDITAKKAVEQKFDSYVLALEESKQKLSELNSQKNKLLSILSHDLRSPFTSILGFCEILIKDNDTLPSEERLQFLGFIQEAARDQLTTVNNLLDWTRIESGRITTDMKNLDLHEIVRKSVNTLLGLAKQKDLHLLNRVARGTYILGNPQLLIQLFTNLIGNALKFTPSGGGVFVELAKEEADKWTVAVRDTGVGIPEKDFSKLFKIDEKYTREGLNGERGTGLGLPICYEIVQKHKGSITVQSVYGTGTTFYIQFPRISFEAGKLILIVDNEPGVRILHSKYIQRLCPTFKIVHASDGEEAFDLARSLQPLLIISDHDMPNVNGYDFLNQLKADPSTQNIPIVFVTGHDSHAVQETLKSLGVSEVIHKPITQEKLEIALSRIGILKKCEIENQSHSNIS